MSEDTGLSFICGSDLSFNTKAKTSDNDDFHTSSSRTTYGFRRRKEAEDKDDLAASSSSTASKDEKEVEDSFLSSTKLDVVLELDV